VISALETVVGLAASPGGLVAIGTAAALMALVRRGGKGRRRTD
jgi:hypothetical protein